MRSLLSVLLLLASCSQPPRDTAGETVADLLALPATSRVALGQVKVGTPAGQQYLRDDWPFPGYGGLWEEPGLSAKGPSPKVRFSLLLPTDLNLEASYLNKGAPVQVEVSCNEERVGEVALAAGQGIFSILLPERVLKPGLNHFSLRLPESVISATVWKTFSLAPRDGPCRVEGKELILPPRSVNDFYFLTPARAEFEAQVQFMEQGDQLRGEFVTADSAEPKPITVGEGGRCQIDLGPTTPGQPCRLTLVGGNSEIRLTTPIVRGEGQAEQPDAPTPRSNAREASSQDARPPLILMLCIDTLRADVLGAYGADPSSTPCLDSADLSVFKRVCAQSGWTKSSMASVFTGRDVMEHGVYGFRDKLPEQEATLAESLGALGYRTVGLTANRWTGKEFGFSQGFDSYESIPAQADLGVDMAIAQLDDRAQRPTFLYLHLLDPHDPYDPPAAFHPPDLAVPDASEERLIAIEGIMTRGETVEPAVMEGVRALYSGEVRFVDREIGRLLDYLKSAGLYEQALIIVFSDHGEEFGEHQKMRHGNSLHQELLAVPWLIKLPTDSKKPLPLDAMVGHIDMMPTILGILDAPTPDRFNGLDLTRADADALRQRTSLGYLENGADAELMGVHTSPWNRLYESATGFGYKLHLRRVDSFSPRLPMLTFYHLPEDPSERKDLSRLGKVEMGYLWTQLEAVRRRAVPSQQADLDPTRDAFRSLPYLR
jgi:arylsulfatase A-like enzyme